MNKIENIALNIKPNEKVLIVEGKHKESIGFLKEIVEKKLYYAKVNFLGTTKTFPVSQISSLENQDSLEITNLKSKD